MFYHCTTDNRKYEVYKDRKALMLRCLDCKTKSKAVQVSEDQISKLISYNSFVEVKK